MLYLKPTEQGRNVAGTLDEAPAYPGARPSIVVPEDLIEDRDWLSDLVRITADALPAPRSKPARKRRAT